MKVAIVGAGIAGLACANTLRSHAITPYLFDKGKRPGGRLSTLTLDDRQWDFGCPYIRPTRPEFAAEAENWVASGWLAPWDEGPAGALVGVPMMASVVAAQCANHQVHFLAQVQHITTENRRWLLSGPDLKEGPFDAMVLALPSQQAAPLLSLHDLEMAREAATSPSAPCWTVLVEFRAEVKGCGPFYEGDGQGPVALAVRTNSKPRRDGAETWVVHASPSWSQSHLEDDQEHVAATLLQHFQSLQSSALPHHNFLKAHRWRFAHSYGPCDKILWNKELKLGACGDWCASSGIEGAWISGVQLAEQIIGDI